MRDDDGLVRAMLGAQTCKLVLATQRCASGRVSGPYLGQPRRAAVCMRVHEREWRVSSNNHNLAQIVNSMPQHATLRTSCR